MKLKLVFTQKSGQQFEVVKEVLPGKTVNIGFGIVPICEVEAWVKRFYNHIPGIPEGDKIAKVEIKEV